MSDICQLMLDRHHVMRNVFAELDELSTADPEDPRPRTSWDELRRLLDAHAEAEELLFYPLPAASSR